MILISHQLLFNGIILLLVSHLNIISTIIITYYIGDALFVVSYNPSSSNSWPESPFLTRDPQAAVDGLVPGKTYTFNVKPVVDNVEGKANTIKTTLPLPEKPTKVVIDDVTDSKFKIEWESPYEDAMYIVNVMDSNGQLTDFPMTVNQKEVKRVVLFIYS